MIAEWLRLKRTSRGRNSDWKNPNLAGAKRGRIRFSLFSCTLNPV